MTQDLQTIVSETLKRRLRGVTILATEIADELDHDGDPILRVTVTFEADEDQLNAQRLKGLTRHLRSALEGVQEDRFPVVNFQTVKEASDPAAA